MEKSLEAANNEDKSQKMKIRKDGWSFAFLLLANEALATLAFFGVGVNLVLFLTRVMGESNASAAHTVSIWTGTVYLSSLIGAFLNDSYWCRFLTCTLFQAILLVGLMLLTLTSWLLLQNPKDCGDGTLECETRSSYGSFLFYVAIYLVAFGYGGHQPTLAAFGADQFNGSTAKHRDDKSAFFCYFYFSLKLGSLFSNAILYYEVAGQWTLGFCGATFSAEAGILMFLLGFSGYKHVNPSGNPVPRMTQVLVAAAKKWNLTLEEGDKLYEVQGSKSAIRGSRKIMHTDEFRCLDKAAIMVEQEKGPTSPWRLCSVTQVEEAKCLIRMLPICLCTIVYSVVFTHTASLFVEQGELMNSKIGKFHLPAGMMCFDICSVVFCTAIYRAVLVPVARKLCGNPKGLTELQRIGVGLVIGMVAMVTAGVTENARLRRVVHGESISSLSILWQIPQYVLVGASEVFVYVGQLEFFNGQAPGEGGMKSFASSLCIASISLGNFISRLLVRMVMGNSTTIDRPGWIPEYSNEGKMDCFYVHIGMLICIDFFVFIACAKWYKCPKVGDNEENGDGGKNGGKLVEEGV